MGAWAGQPNIGGMQPQQQGGDVPPFDLPQAPQALGSAPQMPMMGSDPRTWSPTPFTPAPGGDMQYRDPGIGNSPRQQMRMPSGDEAPDHKAYLRQLYRQELGRNVDPEGYNYWLQQMNNGMSQDQVRQMFDQSQEGQAYNQQPPQQLFTKQPTMDHPPFSNDPRNPHMPPEIADALRLANQPRPVFGSGPNDGGPRSPNMDFLNRLYEDELGRGADKGGINYWQQQMAGGMSPEQVRQMFDQSEEGQAYNKRPMIPQPQTRPGGGVGGPHMPPGLAGLLGGMLPPQPNYNRAPPSQEELDYAQRLGKEPFSPEVQDALRIAKGLPVY